MNVNIYYIKDYQIFIPLAGQKNKPNSNPISENLFMIKTASAASVKRERAKRQEV